MSVNDQNDWHDSLDFESLADEHEEPVAEEESEATESALPDFEDMPAMAEEPTSVPKSKPTARAPRAAGMGLGLLFAFSILVAGAGIGGALLVALGVEPLSLWRPEGIRELDQLLDLDRNPLNLVYLVVLATVLLTMLGTWAVTRAVRVIGMQANRNAALLDRVSALRIDEEAGWQDPAFREHPALQSFINENLGAWRLHQTRQKRGAGLEGEMLRLTRAAAEDNREELAGRFDNPTAGGVADELVRYFDERAASRSEAEAIRTKDHDEAETILQTIVQVTGWNLSFTDRVGVQGAAAAGLAGQLRDLRRAVDGDANPFVQAQRAVATLRRELNDSNTDTARQGEAVTELITLVERGTKLAFQIAMEVARLGPRGERLLPMTQTLEELTTDFRQVADRIVGPDNQSEFQDRLDQNLAALHDRLDPETGASGIVEGLRQAGPVAAELAQRLGQLAETADEQNTRLNELGTGAAAFTGLEFDLEQVAVPETPATSSLEFTRFDPFSGTEEGEEQDAAPAADFIAAPDPFGDNSPDQPEVLPVSEPDEDPAEPENDATLPLEDTTVYDPWENDEPADEVESPAAEATEDPVLDLGDFGAVKLDAALPTDEEAADDVLDLAVFDAVRLD